MKKERIGLNDTPMDIAFKLSEGNPGGLRVIMDIMKKSETIDPDAAFGPFAHLLILDTHNIYGSKIWILYKDICKENLVHMLGVLRAVQLGILPEDILDMALNSDGRDAYIDVQMLLSKVQEQLPRFEVSKEPVSVDTKETVADAYNKVWDGL